jgi:hypothetical protein
MVELLDGAGEADRPLLDEVVECDPAAAVALGDRVDESQVALDHLLLGSEVAAFDAPGEPDLLRRREHSTPRGALIGWAAHLRPPRRVPDAPGPRASPCAG